jgi:BirA family biotin operon repressor/biotin-[acetyl-CoA-carboxylase] ligase
VRIELPSGEFVEGRALDVETDGRLVVLDSCGVTQRLDIGDIVHLRT